MNVRGLVARLLSTSATMFVVVLVGACVPAPKDAPPQKPLPTDTALGLDGDPAPPVADRWWQAFGDPQLDALVARALAQSPQLAEALARLRAAQAQADVAHAGQLPVLALDGTETRERFSATDILPPPYGGSTFWRGSVMLDFSWELDFWGRQAALIAQSVDQAKAAQLDIESARLLLAGSLAQAYVDLYRAEALAELAERTEAQRQNILDITEKRIAAGLDTRVELRQAQGALPQARVEHEQAAAAAELARHQLALLVGAGAENYAGITRPALNLDAVLPLPRRLPADLLARRPDVLAARLAIDAADSGRVAAKAAFYPSIDLTGFAGWGSIALSDLIDAPSRMYGIGPTLHLPLFDAGKLRADYRNAGAQIDLAVARYNDTVLHAVKEAADALARIDSLNSQLADQQLSLDAVEDAYRIAEERYRAGLAGYLSVLSAETQVLNARRNRVEIIADLTIARVSLLLALGGSFDPGAAAEVAHAAPAAPISLNTTATP